MSIGRSGQRRPDRRAATVARHWAGQDPADAGSRAVASIRGRAWSDLDRSGGVVGMTGEGEEGVVSMGVAFREWLSGAPGGDYLSREIVDCGGAPLMLRSSGSPPACRSRS